MEEIMNNEVVETMENVVENVRPIRTPIRSGRYPWGSGEDPFENGDRLGWNLDDGKIELETKAKIADDGRP